MLPDNDRFRDFLGVTAWHKAGFTGKRGLTASGEDFTVGKGHPYQTYLIFKEFAPDREVIYLPSDMKKSAAEVMARKVDTMWASLSVACGGEDQDAPMEPTTPFFSYFMSAGNKGKDDYNARLRGKYIYGGGSYHLMADETTSPVSYSSVTEHVDFCAPELVSFPTASGRGSPFPGTSCAAPVLTGMAALVNDFFIDKTGKPLSSAMMYQFLRDCSVDMTTVGKDTKTGWGAPILPPPETIDIWKYWEASKMDYKDKENIPKWAADSVSLMTDLGIMGGNEKGEFMPTKTMTRSEVAVTLANMYKKMVSENA